MSKSYKNIRYEDYEEYEEIPCFEKLKRGPKKKNAKGHQSIHQNNGYEELDDIIEEITPSILDTPTQTTAVATKVAAPDKSKVVQTTNRPSQFTVDRADQAKKSLEFGPNTHELMGNKIDYDRVANVEMIQSEYKGKQTFGIKFTFKGKNANTRTVWYNQRQRERDMVFAQEYKFWLTVRS